MKERTPTVELIRKLRNIAQSGMILSRYNFCTIELSPYNFRTIEEAADRLEELDERVAIMYETEVPSE